MRGEDPVGGEYGNSFLVPQNYSVVSADGKVLLQPNQTPQDAPETPSEDEDDVTITESQKSIKGVKDDLRNKYAQKVSKQEEEFIKVFEETFQEQRDKTITEFKRVGTLPSFDDNETAKKFQPAIKEVYENSFKEAI
jgi:hypothetical protein